MSRIANLDEDNEDNEDNAAGAKKTTTSENTIALG